MAKQNTMGFEDKYPEDLQTACDNYASLFKKKSDATAKLNKAKDKVNELMEKHKIERVPVTEGTSKKWLEHQVTDKLVFKKPSEDNGAPTPLKPADESGGFTSGKGKKAAADKNPDAGKKTFGWRKRIPSKNIEEIGLTDNQAITCRNAGITKTRKLREVIDANPDSWYEGLDGVGAATATQIQRKLELWEDDQLEQQK